MARARLIAHADKTRDSTQPRFAVTMRDRQQQDSFLELSKQLAQLSRAEVASHEALTKRIVDLETMLATARKELADVRVRNERLAGQLKVAQQAAATDIGDVPPPAPAPAAAAPQDSAEPAGDDGEEATEVEAEEAPAAEDAQAPAADAADCE